jgi:hemerythrin-like domain-containing protein
MKTATENLEKDHEYILRLIDVMERMVMNLSTDSADMELVVSLIQQYADGFHHAKEENFLFKLLVEKGFSNEQGPVSVMLHNHAEGRNFVAGMQAAIEKYKQGDDSILPEVFRNMQGYIDLLRAHIGKENKVLFRMADTVFTDEEQENLLKQFAAVEAKDYPNGKIQEFITDIEGLEVVYL